MNRYPHNDFTKIISLVLRGQIALENNMLKTSFMDQVDFWEPVDSLTFRKRNNNELLAFSKDENAQISHAFPAEVSIFAYEKTGGIDSRAFHLGILILLVLASLLTILLWPFLFIARRNYYLKVNDKKQALPFAQKLVAWLAAFVFMVFYIGLALTTSDPGSIVFNVVPPGIRLVLFLPIIFIVLVIIMLFYTYKLWRLEIINFRSKLFYSILLLFYIFAIWQMNYWNFIGFSW